jgi:hypothetical protein
MGKIVVPEPGETRKAVITKIERSTAGEQFTSKDGKFTGKFSEPNDIVFVLYGKLEGQNDEQKLGTVNKPASGTAFPSSKLYALMKDIGVKSIEDDLHDLKGKNITMLRDERGFFRMPG